MVDAADKLDRSRILIPYTPDPDAPARKLRRWVGLGVLFFFCWFWGLAFAFLAPFLLLIFVVPAAVLASLCVWALPAEMSAPLKAMNWLFFAYLVVKLLWPDYLAIDVRVLPWITVARLAAIGITITLLISLSVSETFRKELKSIVTDSKIVFYFLIAFNLIQILTLPLSHSLSISMGRFYNDEINWIFMFFVACWVFAHPGRAERWTNIFWIASMPIAVLATFEFLKHHVLWAGHIPAFLRIEDPSIQMMLAGVERAYTGRYRAIGTFTTPLGLGEYFALAAPFAFNVVLNAGFSRNLRITAAAAIPMIMLGVWLTNARVGSIGFLTAFVIFGLIWTLHQRRFRPRNVFASLINFSYPVLFLGLISATVVFGRLRRIVWGGGETNSSTEGRKAQVEAAIPLIEKNPIGHGVAMAAQTLGFRAPSGLLTIDSYFLSILLEYGVIGFLAYYGMFAWGAGRAIRVGMAQPPEKRELGLLIPAGVSLIIYIQVKSVFSEELNNSLGFIILALTCALIHRVKVEAPVKPMLQPEEAIPSYLDRRRPRST